MDLVNGKHDYHLKNPILVHFKGEGEKEVILLEMREPARAHVKKSAKLKQMIMQALVGVSENINLPGEEVKQIHDKNDEEHEQNAEEMIEAVRACLLLSKNVDFGDFVETFISMATKNSKKELILCDGKVPISDVHFDQMTADEINEMAIAYASFFYMPSVMQGNE